MGILEQVDWKKFAVVFLFSALMLMAVLAIFPPLKQDKTVSFYNPKTEKTDYAYESNGAFLIAIGVYIILTALVAAVVLDINKNLDFLQLYDRIPTYFRVKLHMPEYRNLSLEKALIKEQSDGKIFALIDEPDNRLMLEMKQNPSFLENPCKKVCTLDISIESVQYLFKDKIDLFEMLRRLDKLVSKENSPITQEALKSAIMSKSEQERVKDNLEG